jgi:hypothetical protein
MTRIDLATSADGHHATVELDHGKFTLVLTLATGEVWRTRIKEMEVALFAFPHKAYAEIYLDEMVVNAKAALQYQQVH